MGAWARWSGVQGWHCRQRCNQQCQPSPDPCKARVALSNSATLLFSANRVMCTENVASPSIDAFWIFNDVALFDLEDSINGINFVKLAEPTLVGGFVGTHKPGRSLQAMCVLQWRVSYQRKKLPFCTGSSCCMCSQLLAAKRHTTPVRTVPAKEAFVMYVAALHARPCAGRVQGQTQGRPRRRSADPRAVAAPAKSH